MQALRDYLDKANISQSEFAERIGLTPGRVSQILKNPDQRPTLEVMQKIEKVTRGRIKIRDWVRAA